LARVTYLERRGATYYARLDVPLDLVGHYGTTTRKKSLRTKDENEAKKLLWPVIESWRAEFEEVRARREITDDDKALAVWQHYEATIGGYDRKQRAMPTPDDAAAELQPPARAAAPSSELNAFTCLKIATHVFKDFEFDPAKVDGFVDDIQAWSAGMTRARFNSLMRETIGVVKRYKQHFEDQNPQASFNPYTVIRHCLYLSNKTAFRPALRNSPRQSFRPWLNANADPKVLG